MIGSTFMVSGQVETTGAPVKIPRWRTPKEKARRRERDRRPEVRVKKAVYSAAFTRAQHSLCRDRRTEVRNWSRARYLEELEKRVALNRATPSPENDFRGAGMTPERARAEAEYTLGMMRDGRDSQGRVVRDEVLPVQRVLAFGKAGVA